MNKKILLPVFFAVMTVTAAEIVPKPMPTKVIGQQQEELYSLKLLNTTKRARSKLQLKQDASAELKTIISTKKHRNNAFKSRRRFYRTTGSFDCPQSRFSNSNSI